MNTVNKYINDVSRINWKNPKVSQIETLKKYVVRDFDSGFIIGHSFISQFIQ